MESFNESSLSAHFPGLVDVCSDDDGQLLYAILKNGELSLAREYVTDTESFSPPEKKHFQFTIPRAAEVLRYFGQHDATLYDDLLSYLKRFSALDDEQWAIVAHYVFLTYLHDHPGIDSSSMPYRNGARAEPASPLSRWPFAVSTLSN